MDHLNSKEFFPKFILIRTLLQPKIQNIGAISWKGILQTTENIKTVELSGGCDRLKFSAKEKVVEGVVLVLRRSNSKL